MNIAWRSEWIHPFETPWSIFEKMCFANRVERYELLSTFGIPDVKGIKNHIIGGRWRELRNLSGFDYGALTLALDYNLIEHNRTAISNIISPLHYCKERIDSWFKPHLRWCEHCMNTGYHSWLHQFIMVHTCPNHDEHLLESCPSCGKQIPFLLSNKQLSAPFTCRCGYRLADFSTIRWQTWNTTMHTADKAVDEWLSENWENKQQGIRWLFIPKHSDLHLLTKSPQVRSTNHWSILSVNDEPEYMRNEKIRERAFIENRNVYMSVDRYLRKKVLKHHSSCIENMLELKKGEGEEFPPICPFAYAYVFWRKSLLQLEQFYRQSRSDGIASPKLYAFESATRLIHDELKYYRSRFMEYSPIPTEKKEAAVNWLLNRVTADFCINFFHEWLMIAQRGAADIKVPGWAEIKIMKERSMPKIAFKFNVNDDSKGRIEYVQVRPDNRSIKNSCPYDNINKRKVFNKMKTHHPLKVAMMIIDNPSEENKQLSKYVDRYINQLAF